MQSDMPPDVTLLLRSSLRAVEEDPEEARERFHAAAERAMEPCESCGKPIRHRQGLGWCQDRQMSERKLQDRIVDRAKRRGWRVAHAGKGWVGDQETGVGQFITPMAPGWPDLMLFKPGMPAPVFAAELKREDGVISDEQAEWLDLLNACGIPAIVFRPSDLRQGRVNAILDGK